MVSFRSMRSSAEQIPTLAAVKPQSAGVVIPLEPITTLAPGVTSEVGRLRSVIVHRPGAELRRLTPDNKDRLLFDDVIWVERAQEEHDALTEMLRARRVEVLYVSDLLVELLEVAAARSQVLEETLRGVALGPTLGSAVGNWLAALPAPELADRLIGGITYAELPFASNSLLAQVSNRDAFVLPPLPNQMFTRDSSTWTPGGVFVHRMASAVRRREGIHLGAIYRYHPRFAERACRIWNERYGTAELEGGDVLVLDDSTLVVGMGERSSPVAVEQYARRLFDENLIDRVIAVVLPQRRSSMHLDTVLTMVDVDAFMTYPPVHKALEAYVLRPWARGVRTERAGDLAKAISAMLGREIRVIEGAGDDHVAQREQWDDGTNLLAVAPGVVVAYERNAHANARLQDHGIEVLTIPGSEIARGRGGPRCLTCPVARDRV